MQNVQLILRTHQNYSDDVANRGVDLLKRANAMLTNKLKVGLSI